MSSGRTFTRVLLASARSQQIFPRSYPLIRKWGAQRRYHSFEGQSNGGAAQARLIWSTSGTLSLAILTGLSTYFCGVFSAANLEDGLLGVFRRTESRPTYGSLKDMGIVCSRPGIDGE
jgi:hypothetical protein